MDFRRIFSKFWPMLVAFSILSYFGYHSLSGERGLLQLSKLQAEVDKKDLELMEVEHHHNSLEKKLQRLHPSHIDLDFLGEQAGKILNFHHVNDIVVLEETE